MGTLSACGITVKYSGSYPNGGTRQITFTSASINESEFLVQYSRSEPIVILRNGNNVIASKSLSAASAAAALDNARVFVNELNNRINVGLNVNISRQHSATTSTFSLVCGGLVDSNEVSVAARASYDVAYNANGGTGTTSAQKKWYNESLQLRANGFSRSGYTFKQWNTKADGSGTAYSASGSYTGNSALTLYAIWNRTVTFNANGGTGAPSAQTAIATNDITLSSTRPTYTGFSFKRWNTNTSDTGTAYSPGGTYAANRASVTLYAIWNHTITFNANGGTGAPGSQTALKASTITVSTVKPTRSGYVFHHWNTKADGSGTTYNAGSTFAANAASITLYAIWHHTVTYNANGGANAPATQSAAAGTAITVSNSSPTRANYRFVTWNTKADGSGTNIAPNTTLGANDTNRTLYAIWEFYVKPTATKYVCTRCDSNGHMADEGTCVLVAVDWRVTALSGVTGLASLNVVAKTVGGTTVDSDSLANIVGTASGDFIVGSSSIVLDGPFSIDDKFTVEITLNDGTSQTRIADIISKAFFPFDVMQGGHGAAFGKPATIENLFDVAYNGNFDGDLTARSVTQTSDRRLKQHVQTLGSEAVEFVDGLNPVLFNNAGLILPGFYAQDVQEIDPYESSMVQIARNGYLSLNYTAIIAPLVAYVQMLERRVKALEEGDE